jgi:hypothetical protein
VSRDRDFELLRAVLLGPAYVTTSAAWDITDTRHGEHEPGFLASSSGPGFARPSHGMKGSRCKARSHAPSKSVDRSWTGVVARLEAEPKSWSKSICPTDAEPRPAPLPRGA